MLRWLVLLGCGACTFVDGTRPQLNGDAAGVDTVDSKPIDTPTMMFCFGSTAEDKVCLSEMPTGAMPLSGIIDTDSSVCSTKVLSGPAGCVIAADTITVGGFTSVFGSKPLILIANDTISVSSLLDVSSHRLGKPGPGFDAPTCKAAGPTTGTGGGAGGSFGGTGGKGGNQNGGNPGAMPGMAFSPTMLQGGCPGSGGGGSSANGGHGGGAVLLIAQTIAITQTINASGESGAGGTGGGGGGGSGGMIALDAQSITGSGAIMANGGGGGGGGNILAVGREPDPSNPQDQAAGGNGANNANGGEGGGGTVHDGAPGDPPQSMSLGGGGGGGGVGVIRFYGAAQSFPGGTVSPQ